MAFAEGPPSRMVCGVLVIAAGIYGAALALFSFAPPELPIFLPPV